MTSLPIEFSSDVNQLGVILVDHGSRRGESNEMLLEAVRQFAAATRMPIVEPAHMELAEPSIATAFDRCVDRGATTVVVFPYFLLPGRHWHDDIPRLTEEAAAKHPGVKFLVTAPFALHPLMFEVISDRIERCLARAEGQIDACDACTDAANCQFRGASI